MTTPVPEKKKGGRKWFPPREDRGNYRFFKKWAHKVEVLNALALPSRYSISIKPAFKTWLIANIGEGKFGYELNENGVTFGFKTELDLITFERFLESQDAA